MDQGLGAFAMVAASSFDEEFKAWFADGAMSSVLYTVIVLAVIAIVIKATT